MSIGNEKMTICHRCGETVPEVSFYSDHLPNKCKGKMREQIIVYLDKFLRSHFNNNDIDHIKIREGHRDITIKFVEEYDADFRMPYEIEFRKIKNP